MQRIARLEDLVPSREEMTLAALEADRDQWKYTAYAFAGLFLFLIILSRR